MPAGTHLKDLFMIPDVKMPDLQLGELLKEYGRFADDVWAKAPILIQEYTKFGRETWNTYTETHLKRFSSLSSADQSRFMNSGLDGAVVFLLLTMISRMILTKSLEPYLLQYFQHSHGHSFSLTFNQAKWVFSASLLLAIWHANSHVLFNLGVPVDLSVMLGTASALAFMIYRQSSSVKACFAFFAVPALVLLPVSITVAIMQHGPYITQAKMFPRLLAVVTVITAIYFIFEAPPTAVVKSGHAMPFGAALQHEISDLWNGEWRHRFTAAPGRLADTVVHGPRKLGQRAIHASSKAIKKSGAKVTDFVATQEEGGRQVIRAAGPILQSVFTPICHFFQGLFLFVLGLVYRANKFLCFLYQSLVDTIVASLARIPGMAKYLLDGRDHKEDHSHAHHYHRESSSRDHSEERSRSGTITPKLSRRVSRPRDGDEADDNGYSPPRERKGRRNNRSSS